MDKRKSGHEAGQDYVGRMRDHLAVTEGLPLSRDGSLNVTALAKASNVPRQSIYKNPGVRALVEDVATARGIPTWADQHITESRDDESDSRDASDQAEVESSKRIAHALERKVQRLERLNANLAAENFALRREVATLKLQRGREDMIIETGRRIVPLPAKAP